jgi:hypothetical protein
MKHFQQTIGLIVLLSLATNAAAFSAGSVDTYQNIKILQPAGEHLHETSVKVQFNENSMLVISRSSGKVLKEWSYDKIKSAEYSYTKTPRWKTGLGLGAASIAFPLLLIVAIPIGFTKHRRHWVTIRTEDDFAVLKVGKGIRKVFMPAFETRTSVQIQALGDDK